MIQVRPGKFSALWDTGISASKFSKYKSGSDRGTYFHSEAILPRTFVEAIFNDVNVLKRGGKEYVPCETKLNLTILIE